MAKSSMTMIEWIKAHRLVHNCSLREAKDAWDAEQDAIVKRNLTTFHFEVMFANGQTIKFYEELPETLDQLMRSVQDSFGKVVRIRNRVFSDYVFIYVSER